jgi:hypothetical protein
MLPAILPERQSRVRLRAPAPPAAQSAVSSPRPPRPPVTIQGPMLADEAMLVPRGESDASYSISGRYSAPPRAALPNASASHGLDVPNEMPSLLAAASQSTRAATTAGSSNGKFFRTPATNASAAEFVVAPGKSSAGAALRLITLVKPSVNAARCRASNPKVAAPASAAFCAAPAP